MAICCIAANSGDLYLPTIKNHFFLYFSMKNEIQNTVSAAFIKTFQLNDDDLKALHGNKQQRDVPITKDIFIALEKVQKIHSDCKIMMQSGHQTLALDIMEQMTLNQVGHKLLIKYVFFTLKH